MSHARTQSTVDDHCVVLFGTSGNDEFQSRAQQTLVDGFDGADLMDYSAEARSLVIVPTSTGSLGVYVDDQAKDFLRNIEKVIGGSGNDYMFGSSGREVFQGGPGRDILDGGGGRDFAEYSDKTDSVVVDLSGPGDIRVMVGGREEDILRNIESVIGGSGNDTLTGSVGANALSGGAGDDILVARGGLDVLLGGEGADTFVFARISDSPKDVMSQIMDFSSEQGDRIDLSAIDANVRRGGVQSLTFNGETPGANSAWYSRGEDYGWFYTPPKVHVDVTGDAVEDMVIRVDTYDGLFQATAASLSLAADLA